MRLEHTSTGYCLMESGNAKSQEEEREERSTILENS